MRGRHPGEEHSEPVLQNTQGPIAYRFRAGVRGGSAGCLGAMRREGHTPGQQCRADPPLLGYVAKGAIGEKRSCRWTNKSMDRVPGGVDIGDLVSNKFDDEKRGGYTKHNRVGEDLKAVGKLD